MPQALIEFDRVGFRYPAQPVFTDLSLKINAGDFLGLIGPNGAGKSTLLRLAAGLLTGSQGQITLQGRAISDYGRKSLARIIGYVPQEVDVTFDYTVQQVVAMGRYPHLQGFFYADEPADEVIQTAMRWLDLGRFRQRLFPELSGGEKQRVIIAAALAQQASIILLDEPTSASDLKHQQDIYHVLSRLCREENKTIVVVTHEINLAAQFCNRLLLMDQGKIVADGPPGDVLKFQLIQQVYQVKVYIDINPFTKSVYLLPYETISNNPVAP
jgi:iron complex transport system ATP-binding protein